MKYEKRLYCVLHWHQVLFKCYWIGGHILSTRVSRQFLPLLLMWPFFDNRGLLEKEESWGKLGFNSLRTTSMEGKPLPRTETPQGVLRFRHGRQRGDTLEQIVFYLFEMSTSSWNPFQNSNEKWAGRCPHRKFHPAQNWKLKENNTETNFLIFQVKRYFSSNNEEKITKCKII